MPRRTTTTMGEILTEGWANYVLNHGSSQKIMWYEQRHNNIIQMYRSHVQAKLKYFMILKKTKVYLKKP